MSQEKPFDKESQGAQYGAARIAPSLGADDPRTRRNAAAFLSDDMLGVGLVRDQEGRIAIKIADGSALKVDADGVSLTTDGVLVQTPGSPVALRLTEANLLKLLRGKKGQSPLLGFEDIRNERPHEFHGMRTARAVLGDTRDTVDAINMRLLIVENRTPENDQVILAGRIFSGHL